MADSLASVLDKLSLSAQKLDPAAIDALLVEEQNGTSQKRKPRQQSRQTREDLLKELEDEFLTPSTNFSSKWLNQLQK